MIRKVVGVVGALVCSTLLGTQQGSAQVLFSENFDVDHTANWLTFVAGTGTHSADFFFDYSTVGIPAAPNSIGGTTRGLKLQANIDPLNVPPPATVTGVSVSPVGGDFTGNYRLRFDMWLNFHGPLDVGGNGSTEITSAGIGTAATNLQIAGRTPDSVYFGASGDGGSTADYRAYSPASGAPGYQDADGVFAAGGRNNTLPYYSGFGGEVAPAQQLALFPGQTGSTAIGAQGFAWRDVLIEVLDATVTFSIDSVIIATVDTTTFSGTGGTNILFNQFDINNSPSNDPNAPTLQFGLIDNIRVELIPEPTAALGAALGLAAMLARRRRR